MALRKALLYLLSTQVIVACLASPLAAQTLRIDAPAGGSVAAPGQTVTVSVTASGATFSQVGIVAENPIDFSNLLTAPPYQFQIVIPTTTPAGTYHLTALGTAGQGSLVESQPVTIYVEPAANPVGISIQPVSLIFDAQGQQVPLQVVASYSGDVVQDVSGSSQWSYSSSDPAVVSVDPNGVVTAAGPGTASISVSYARAASAAVLASVRPLTLTAAPASLTFDDTNLGATSTAQSVNVTNTSGISLSVMSAAISGDFTEADHCSGKTLVAGGVCSIDVTYAPASAGQAGGQLTLVNSIDIVPLTVQLSGTGVSTTAATLLANLSRNAFPLPMGAPLSAGQSGIEYSLSVQNVAAVSFSGTATVTETLPAALTLTSLSGEGWTCSVSLAQCSRSDALGAFQGYPQLTAVVSVSENAPPTIESSATLSYTSGAGTAIYTATDSALVLPLMQTIAFGPLNNQTMGVAPFLISAVASSGLPVTFTSTTLDVCTVAGSVVTVIAIGNCSITASQPSDGDVPAAPSVTQAFVVSAAWQTITF